MAWYDTGTVNVTANSATVTGVGTQWLAGARRGEAFVAPDGRLYEVLNIASNTSLTLTKPYRGTTATGQQYALAPMQGYVKELADRAAQLLNEYGLASDAEATARTSKTKALTPYGLGLNVQSSPNDNTVGKLLAVGKSFGLGSVEAGSSYDVWPSASLNNLNVPAGIYLLPPNIADRPPEIGNNNAVIWHRQAGTAGSQIVVWGYGQLIVRARTSGNYSAWREYLQVGQFGLGSVGVSNDYDKWPSASLNDVNVPSGMYYVNGSIADRPTTEDGIVWHRQAGSAGGQIYISVNGLLLHRARRSSAYRAWSTVLNVTDFGLGGGTVTPPNGLDSVNPFGWYYAASPVPTWGGGSFFLDMPYSSNQNAGLRLSTDPYSDNFYMNGAVSGQKTFRDACKLVHDKNIVGSIAAGSVIETGFNANGKWAKYADGTLICWSPPMTSKWIDGTSGSLWVSASSTWTFPMAFINLDNYVLHIEATTSLHPIWGMVGENKTNSSCQWKLASGSEWKEGLPAYGVAIGRWKA
ncbi:hypothetical protein [Alcaligenes phenolicus]|uniref:hypothetical protein n=1 Tax=Alcaligenes phenolicus TaxID=232846 RepID=UPI002AA80E3C|nr:hypothetical protein [Alcaligenes phenolicus]